MNRDITGKISYFLDEWVPPKIRDSKFLVRILFRIAIGRKYKHYMNFKDRLPYLSEKDVNRYYDVLSKTFISRDTHCNRECVDRIIRDTVGKTILDAGGGKGYIAQAIKKAEMSRICTVSDIVLPSDKDKYHGLNYVSASITELPFENSYFDTVVCTHTLEHILDPVVALDEVRRVCKNRLIIVLPRQREYRYTYDLHIHFFPYKYNVELMMNSGDVDRRNRINIELVSGDWFIIEEMKK